MGLIKKIKQGINYFKNYKKEQLEKEKREEELVETVKRLRNIDLFGEKEKQINSTQNSSQVKNIKFYSRKIEFIHNFNIDKMNKLQLENAYNCVKKSINDAEKRGIQEEIDELKQLKRKIKQKLIEKNDDFDIQSIRNTLMLGSVDKIDMYETVLINLYKDLETKSKVAQFDDEFQQMRIHVLALLKLINKIKKTNKTYIKKIA